MPRPSVTLTAAMLLALATMSPLAQSRVTSPTQAARPAAPAHVTSPIEQWGHNVGDDYFLADYQQLVSYWHKLERETPRVHLVDIGRTSQNRPQVMAVVTSPQNYARIARYREIAGRLARAQGLSDEEARALAREGKAIVWIDGGLHADETLGAQQLLELVYQLATATDGETTRFLRDVIVLAVPSNPDGMDLVSDWYMQHGNLSVPVLYNYYAGHDDNRDFYMSALAESANMNRVLYREWYPQIVYNHHQTGPEGMVMFAPPFRDPFNYYFHPNVPAGIDALGAAMAQRFIAEGKPGVGSRKSQNYSTWWNGGLRTTAYFHNMVGLLTETIGGPDPQSVPFIPARQIPDSSLWWPIGPRDRWHMRQSIEYSITADRAVLDYASRYRETVLYRMYEMGRDEVAWGSEDHWTFTPHEMRAEQDRLGRAGGGAGGGGETSPLYLALTAKAHRDPRGFILPSDQPDFGTATKFVNALIKAGIDVDRATAPFTVAGKRYPANSFVVRTAQAFRPHVLDMFEPQDHPDDIAYPGGPPTPPYDNAGYTLAFQMGVVFDRVLDAFDGPFARVTGLATCPPGRFAPLSSDVGYYFTHQANDSVVVVNRLAAAGEDVRWLRDGPLGAGTFYVRATRTAAPILQRAASELGLSFQGTDTEPDGASAPIRPVHIALVDRYGGSIPSGWTRFVLDQFEFKYDVVYPPTLDAGGLRDKYDVIVFNDEGIPYLPPGSPTEHTPVAGHPPPSHEEGRGYPGVPGPPPADLMGPSRCGSRPSDEPGQDACFGAVRGFADVPEEFKRREGVVTDRTMQQVRAFVDAGGTLVAIGHAAMNAASQFNLPLSGRLADLPKQSFFVPGSILRMTVDSASPLAHGVPSHVDVFFDNDPVFAVNEGAGRRAHRVAWFDGPNPLRSGWAWGAKYLDDGVGMIDAAYGQGRVFLFGPEILFRAQPHGTFKFFFNGLFLSIAPPGF